MRPITQEEYPIETLQRLVGGVRFFKELMQTDSSQFEFLMSTVQFLSADQNELIIEEGRPVQSLYFIVKGELDVLLLSNRNEPISQLRAGEMFGALAMILNQPRSASVRVQSPSALIAKINYTHFLNEHMSSHFTLATKLLFFRMLANNLRWLLDQNRRSMPDHPLTERVRQLPIYTGEKGGEDELKAMQEHALLNGQILYEWNASTRSDAKDHTTTYNAAKSSLQYVS